MIFYVNNISSVIFLNNYKSLWKSSGINHLSVITLKKLLSRIPKNMYNIKTILYVKSKKFNISVIIYNNF